MHRPCWPEPGPANPTSFSWTGAYAIDRWRNSSRHCTSSTAGRGVILTNVAVLTSLQASGQRPPVPRPLSRGARIPSAYCSLSRPYAFSVRNSGQLAQGRQADELG